jgi:hypothetical protein
MKESATEELTWQRALDTVTGKDTHPELIKKVYAKKRYASTPNIASLKEQQAGGFTKIQEMLNSPTGGVLVLKGYAGTGKTYLISVVTEWFLHTYRTKLMAVTAPTNKAVKVLRASAEFTHTNIEYKTIHSLLRLKEVVDAHGNVDFKPDNAFKGKGRDLSSYGVLVLDEVSMLNDELLTMIMPYVQKGLKLIFSGDPAQIPPVGMPDCLPFDEDWQTENGAIVVELTDIVRQQSESPIIDMSLSLRNRLDGIRGGYTEHNVLSDKGSLIIMDARDDDTFEYFTKTLYNYFNSANFRDDSDYMKVIAWRNKTVDKVNKQVRGLLYEEEAHKRVVIGEKLIMNSPVIQDRDGLETVVLTTNAEVTVRKLREKNESINEGQFNIKYYEAEVEEVSADGTISIQFIDIVHEESLPIFNDVCEALKDIAKSRKQGSFEARASWIEYYGFLKRFADVNYNYAITAHKAQGSTYINCMVFRNDIRVNKNTREAIRIEYTAITRAKNTLIVIA